MSAARCLPRSDGGSIPPAGARSGGAAIAFPRLGTPRTGPVSALNLLWKKRTTLEFLRVHHEDLQQAIELAGANPSGTRRPGTASSATPSGPSCARRRPRSRSSRSCLRQRAGIRPVAPAGPVESRRNAPAPAGLRQAPRRSGRALRLGLQPLPGLDERRRRGGGAPPPDGLHRGRMRAQAGEPLRSLPVRVRASGTVEPARDGYAGPLEIAAEAEAPGSAPDPWRRWLGVLSSSPPVAIPSPQGGR